MIHFINQCNNFFRTKPFESSNGICKNLKATFLDADLLSYCYSDGDFENYGTLIVKFFILMVLNISACVKHVLIALKRLCCLIS